MISLSLRTGYGLLLCWCFWLSMRCHLCCWQRCLIIAWCSWGSRIWKQMITFLQRLVFSLCRVADACFLWEIFRWASWVEFISLYGSKLLHGGRVVHLMRNFPRRVALFNLGCRSALIELLGVNILRWWLVCNLHYTETAIIGSLIRHDVRFVRRHTIIWCSILQVWICDSWADSGVDIEPRTSWLASVLLIELTVLGHRDFHRFHIFFVSWSLLYCYHGVLRRPLTV